MAPLTNGCDWPRGQVVETPHARTNKTTACIKGGHHA